MQRLKTEPQTLPDRVSEAIKQHIIDEGLRPGDRLPSEHAMVDMLGVSRTSVREALATLTALGIIDVQTGRGAFVREFDLKAIADQLPYGIEFHKDDLKELVEVRRLLEVYSVRQVAPRIDDDQLKKLGEAVERMRVKAERGEDFIDEDIRFHRLLAEAGGRRVALFILSGFWELQRKIRRIETDPQELEARFAQHDRIYEALKRRDERGAAYFMEVHFDEMEARLSR